MDVVAKFAKRTQEIRGEISPSQSFSFDKKLETRLLQLHEDLKDALYEVDNAKVPNAETERQLREFRLEVEALMVAGKAKKSSKHKAVECEESGNKLQTGVKRGRQFEAKDTYAIAHINKEAAKAFKGLIKTRKIDLHYDDLSSLDGWSHSNIGRVGHQHISATATMISTPKGSEPLILELDIYKRYDCWRKSFPVTTNFYVRLAVNNFIDYSDTKFHGFISDSAEFDLKQQNNGNIFNGSDQYDFVPAKIGDRIKFLEPRFPSPRKYNRPWSVEFLAKMMGSSDFYNGLKDYFFNKADGPPPAIRDLERLAKSGDLGKLINAEKTNASIAFELMDNDIKTIKAGFSGRSR
jgi:hypothetical protein